MERTVRHILWAGLGALAIAPVAVAQIFDTGAAPSSIPVYLEDSPAAQELVDRAFHLRDQGRYVDASAVMQQVIEQFPQKLMRADGPLHEDALRWVMRTIRENPAWLAAYQRTYEPEAARLLTLARGQGPSLPALSAVRARFGLCASGLDATLELAGLWLERGGGDEAATLLDDAADHPVLASHAIRYQQLRAAEAALRGDTATLEAARAELDRVQAGSTVDDLEALAAAVAAAQAEPDHVGQLPESFDAPLWQVTLPDVPAADNAVLLRRLPTLADRMVLVNTGVAVMALDRASGRELWTAGDLSVAASDAQPGRFFNAQRVLPDERGVAVWGNRVMAVLGPDISQFNRRQWWQPATYIAAASRDDGIQLWIKRPQDLDPSLDNTFFHGTPIVGYDRVFVLLRRSQVSGFQDAFVVAVDAVSGELLWRRHLSSAASGHRFAPRPLAQMTYDRGRLYISDNLGVVTCIESTQGTVMWSCLYAETLPQSNQANLARGAAGTLVSPPVVIEAGVVVPPWAGGVPVLLLDKATGRVVRELSNPAWTAATTLVQAGDDVLTVGNNVACFDGRTLELRWLHEGDEPVVAVPAVVGSQVLVPRRQRLVALDLDTGRLQADLRSPGVTSVLFDGGQVILTTNQSVASYMPWPLAYASLTKQMAAAPADPEAGIALAHVATALNRPDAVIEGVEHTVAALRRLAMDDLDDSSAVTRDRMFAQLLSFADGQRLSDTALRRQLFQLIATGTSTAADEVAYRLAIGAFEAQTGQHEAAVDHYQSILLDDALSMQLHQQDGTIRQAWMEARRRLVALVAQHGQGIYARHEAAAGVRLNEIVTTRSSDPTLLEDMARRYPLAEASTQALIAAADSVVARGDIDAAIPLLRQAYRQTRRPEVVADVVGRLAQLSLRMDRPRIAQRWLTTAARQHPGIRPLRDGLPTSIDRWLSELAAIDGAADAMPTLQLPIGSAHLIDGRLLTTPQQSRSPSLSDRIVVQRATTAELRRGDALERQWSANLVAEQRFALLWCDEEQVVLWSTEAGRLVSLDAATGKRLRQDVDTSQLLQSMGDPRVGAAARASQQPLVLREMLDQPIMVRQGGGLRQVDPAQILMADGGPRTFAVANEWVIVLADELGRIACVDRRDGQTLWRLFAPMQRVSSIHITEDALVLAGVTDVGTDAQASLVLVLDPGTGERRCPPLEVKDVLMFVSANESHVVYATATEIAAHHIADGAVAWRLPTEERVLSGQGWIEGNSLMLAEGGATSGLLVIDADEGRIVRRVVGADLGMGEALQLTKIGARWHLRGTRMVASLDAAGRMLWRDAVALDGARFVHQSLGRDLVIALATSEGEAAVAVAGQPNVQFLQGGDQRVINLQLQLRLRAAEAAAAEPANVVGPRRYSVYVFEREGGRLVAEYQIGPLPASLNPAAAIHLDGRIAIACGEQTLILPGAAP